ncbi:MAG: hypothetical protein WCV91_02670 [Candidatus Margulisiibacteriota bacterium]|jgi:hypothetical protein
MDGSVGGLSGAGNVYAGKAQGPQIKFKSRGGDGLPGLVYLGDKVEIEAFIPKRPSGSHVEWSVVPPGPITGRPRININPLDFKPDKAGTWSIAAYLVGEDGKTISQKSGSIIVETHL